MVFIWNIGFVSIHSTISFSSKLGSLFLPVTLSICQAPRKCLRYACVPFGDSIFWEREILLLIKKDRYARELLRFGRRLRRFISLLRFHRRGPLIAANRSRNATRDSQHFRGIVCSFVLKSRRRAWLRFQILRNAILHCIEQKCD